MEAAQVSIDWQTDKEQIHTMEYYSATKINEILPIGMTWMELEIIMLGEINQPRKTNTILF